jgi:serine protease Do
MRDLPRIVAESPVGKAVDVEVVRKGERETVQVTLGRLEDGEQLASAGSSNDDDAAEKTSSVEMYGMTLSELNDDTREEFEIGDSVDSGVVVSAVEAGSAAANKGVAAGQVIVEIAQEAVKSPKEVETAIENLKNEDRRNALLMIADKDGNLRFVTIRID